MKVVVVEDNSEHVALLKQMLFRVDPSLVIGAVADGVKTGLKAILTQEPDLVMLDIELTDGSAFDLLEQYIVTKKIDFSIIFLTGHLVYEYPIRAIHYSALDFLTKPLDGEQLANALTRFRTHYAYAYQENSHEQVQILTESIKNSITTQQRITFNKIGGGIEIKQISDIVFVETYHDMSRVYIAGGLSFSTALPLIHYTRLFEDNAHFLKISSKYLVNTQYLIRFDPESLEVTLQDGVLIAASRRGGQELKKFLKNSNTF
jgi:two-component system LytT family response regulator